MPTRTKPKQIKYSGASTNPRILLSSTIDILTVLIEESDDDNKVTKLKAARELVLQVAVDDAIKEVTAPSAYLNDPT